jgi:hypothetical protein
MGGTGLRAVTTYPTSFRAYEVWDLTSTVSADSATCRRDSSDRMSPTDSADDSLPSPSLTVPPRHPAALGENRRLSLRPYLHIVVCGSYPF